LPHKAEIDIDMENNTAWIRWDTTQKKDLVDFVDLTLKDASPRTCNPQIFIILLQEKKASTEQCQNDWSVLDGHTENIFYCAKNSSKLCTEGAIGNLMNILHCSKNDVGQFWDIAWSPLCTWFN
jgi:hypothetical protein